MGVEVIAHGQELTTEYLDKLFVSIRDQVPEDQWVQIQNNPEQARAGIKHLIDMDMYGHNMDIVFNNEFTHFKKTIFHEHKPYIFERYVIDHTACTRFNEIREAELVEAKARYLRSQRDAEREKERENSKKRKRR